MAPGDIQPADPFVTLNAIASRYGATVSKCQHFDPNVCTYRQDLTNRATLVATDGFPFSRQIVLNGGSPDRIRIRASEAFLLIEVPADVEVPPFAINRRDAIQFLEAAGRARIGNRTYPVFASRGVFGVDQQRFAHEAAFERLLDAVALNNEDSLHVYRNGLFLYLKTPPEDRVPVMVDGLTEFQRRARQNLRSG